MLSLIETGKLAKSRFGLIISHVNFDILMRCQLKIVPHWFYVYNCCHGEESKNVGSISTSGHLFGGNFSG